MGKRASKGGPVSSPRFLICLVPVSALLKPISFSREWGIITGIDKASVCSKRIQPGEVIEDIINTARKVSTKNFWVMSEKENKWILKPVELNNPDMDVLPVIELTWN